MVEGEGIHEMPPEEAAPLMQACEGIQAVVSLIGVPLFRIPTLYSNLLTWSIYRIFAADEAMGHKAMDLMLTDLHGQLAFRYAAAERAARAERGEKGN